MEIELLKEPATWLRETFMLTGLGKSSSNLLTAFILAAIVLMLSYAANYFAKLFIKKVVHRIIRASIWDWDDVFMHNKVFSRLSHLAPAVVIWLMAEWALEGYPNWTEGVQKLSYLYIIVIVAIILGSVLDSLHQLYLSRAADSRRPIKGYIQLLKIVLAIVVMLFVAGVIFEKDVSSLVLGLGGMAAVLMLIFQDTITGLVSSMQISGNQMVKVGDWISMPSRGVDGDVIDMTLYTVKVRNFDRTILTVPTNALMRESFQNWAGMAESGGRRIKRSLKINMKSVKFVDEELRDKLYKIEILRPYIEEKEREIETFNKEHSVDITCPVNGRRMTNLGTFRAYIKAYLGRHPQINTEMIYMIRQLQPDENGIPLEVYVFSAEKEWVKYEGVQADIFDHLLAVIGYFDLQVFQYPSGDDLKGLGAR
jgi:miniconductance mechanosensitive channel